MAEKKNKLISIVVPVYNEERNIRGTVARLRDVMKSSKQEFEIITVDDGSRDNSLKILKKIKKPWLRVYAHKKNQGPGAAFRTGFRNAKGDIIVTIDCDLSFNPRDIPKLLRHINSADAVIGSQHMKGAQMKNIPLIRVIASKTAYILDRIILRAKVPSYTSFFVAYKKDVIKNLKFHSNSFDAQTEIVVKLARKGYKIKGVPCALEWKDKKRKSSMKLFKEFRNRLKLWRMLLSKD